MYVGPTRGEFDARTGSFTGYGTFREGTYHSLFNAILAV